MSSITPETGGDSHLDNNHPTAPFRHGVLRLIEGTSRSYPKGLEANANDIGGDRHGDNPLKSKPDQAPSYGSSSFRPSPYHKR